MRAWVLGENRTGNYLFILNSLIFRSKYCKFWPIQQYFPINYFLIKRKRLAFILYFHVSLFMMLSIYIVQSELFMCKEICNKEICNNKSFEILLEISFSQLQIWLVEEFWVRNQVSRYIGIWIFISFATVVSFRRSGLSIYVMSKDT